MLWFLRVCLNPGFAQQKNNLDSLKNKFSTSFSRINLKAYVDLQDTSGSLIFSALCTMSRDGKLISFKLSKNAPLSFQFNNYEQLDTYFFSELTKSSIEGTNTKYIIPIIYIPKGNFERFKLNDGLSQKLPLLFNFKDESDLVLKDVNLLPPICIFFGETMKN